MQGIEKGRGTPLSRKFAPPSSGRRAPSRLIHPDLFILGFSLVIPFFVGGVLTTQPQALWAAVPVLVGFYAFYLWQRKGLVTRFEKELAERKGAEERVKRAIARWMNLYHCACDDWVFEPGGEATPADQMMGYLFRD